jgi:N-acetyl sugar amidotransferase
MDTTDPLIKFDSSGVCSHCLNFDQNIKPNWFPDNGAEKLQSIVQTIKSERKKHEYDCIIGLSGGVDSAYLAYKVVELGLKPLVVHVDGGWNSEIAVKNIENIIKNLGLDLITHVINWNEMQDLQLAFFKAGVPNQDIPQDHAFFAALYSYAIKNRIRWVLSGSNFATESVLPTAWGYNALDSKHLRAIHKIFGQRKLKTYPTVGFFQYYAYFQIIKKMKVARLLNYMPYNKDEAIKTLENKLGFRYYGGKHFESRFTRFFQAHYLPHKFGYDKRKAHLASMVLAGSISREQALEALKEPLYDPKQLELDKEYTAKKLGISKDEFQALIDAPNHNHEEYPSNASLFDLKSRFRSTLHRFFGNPYRSD